MSVKKMINNCHDHTFMHILINFKHLVCEISLKNTKSYIRYRMKHSQFVDKILFQDDFFENFFILYNNLYLNDQILLNNFFVAI